MNIIGIVDDNDSFEILVTLYKVLNNYHKTKFLSSYKNIFKNNKFNSLDQYLNDLSQTGTDVIIIKLQSADLYSKDFSDFKFTLLILADVKRYVPINFKCPDYLIYNHDTCLGHEFIKKSLAHKFSYGMSYNADIFPSSIEEEYISSTIMICINKNVTTVSNNNVVSQEFSIKMNNLSEYAIYNILASLIVFILCDLKIPEILGSLDTISKEENIHA